MFSCFFEDAFIAGVVFEHGVAVECCDGFGGDMGLVAFDQAIVYFLLIFLEFGGVVLGEIVFEVFGFEVDEFSESGGLFFSDHN